jgi:hypothetical protein
VIKQRKEASSAQLSPDDYANFLVDVAEAARMAIASIQGYEPLLEESWPYTCAILDAAKRRSIRSSIVTNGTHLVRRAGQLVELEPTGITVSIDGGKAEDHDRMRGVTGAFDATVQGLTTLGSILGSMDRVTISSVLMPGRRALLAEVPALLSNLGIQHWVVNPLLRIGRNTVGGTVAPDERVIDDLNWLGDIADRHNIKVALDDELGVLSEHGLDYNSFMVRRFDRPDGLLRLTPTGACSVGPDILRQVDEHTPRWVPSTTRPRDFVRSLLAQDFFADAVAETV